MGLYLCVFDQSGSEVEGVDVGSYADFNCFREAVTHWVEGGKSGSTCPTLIMHSDSDGDWSVVQAHVLIDELYAIKSQFEKLPPVPLLPGWKTTAARTYEIIPVNLAECFFDVDGEPLIDRLVDLARSSIAVNAPIVFQ